MPNPANLDLERLKHARALELEMIRATAAFEHAALKLPFALNGGALGIYLAMYGTLKGGQGLELALVPWAWASWLVGLGAATFATFFGFRSQFAFRKDRGELVRALDARTAGDAEGFGKHNADADCYGKRGSRLRNVASVLVAISFVVFVAGVIVAFRSIK